MHEAMPINDEFEVDETIALNSVLQMANEIGGDFFVDTLLSSYCPPQAHGPNIEAMINRLEEFDPDAGVKIQLTMQEQQNTIY